MTGSSAIFQDAIPCCSDEALILIGKQEKFAATAYGHILEQVKHAATQPIQDLNPYWQLACEAKRIFDDEMRSRFTNIADHLPYYGVGQFDIHSLMARLILIGAKSVRGRQRTGKWIAILCPTSDISEASCIGGIFPQSRFVFLDEVDAAFRESLGDRSLFLASSTESEDWRGSELKSRLDAFWSVHDDQGGSDTDRHDPAQLLTEFCLPGERPIFVVGAGRSGTSAVLGALTQALMLKGWNEGHLFPLAAILARELKARAGKLGLNDGEVEEVWQAPFFEVHSLYKKHFQDEVWVDKTADSEMIRCIPLLRKLYPQARFIYMHRHPVSCVLSRVRKFGEPLESACADWVDCVNAWENVKSDLPPDSYVELSQKELTSDSRAGAEKIGNMLHLNRTDFEAMAEYFSSSRPEFLGDTFSAALLEGTNGDQQRIWRRQAIYGSLRDSEEIELDDVPWTNEQKGFFVATCGELARQIGYMRRSSPEERHFRIARIAARLEEFENKRQAEFANVIDNYAQAISGQAKVSENYAQAVTNYAQAVARQTAEIRAVQDRIIFAKRGGTICGAAGAIVAVAWTVGQAYFSFSPAWLLRTMHIVFVGSLAFPALPAGGIGRLATLAFLVLQNGLLYGSLGVSLPWCFRKIFSKTAAKST